MAYTPAKFRIKADRPDGSEMFLFTWTRGAEAGIERAKRDAAAAGLDHLSNFRAEPIAAN